MSSAARSDDLFDAVVIGTGFGGAVAACRLAQARKKICVLERGRRYPLGDFPRPAKRPDNLPHMARWAWAIDHGLWDVKDLQGVLAAQAAGYGGGSLIYANVHLRPPREIFAPMVGPDETAPGWPRVYTRRVELDRYYDVAAAALQVTPIPQPLVPPSPVTRLQKVDAMRAIATNLGRSQWFFLPPLAIDWHKCVMCAECIAGCQFQAKNTLDLNYLAVAEASPDVDIRTLCEAISIKEEDADHTYSITYLDHIVGGERATVRAKSVFLCAGAVNSTYLLLRSLPELKMIPDESQKQIGQRFFSNGDAIAMVFDTASGVAPKPTQGPTITTTLVYSQNAVNVHSAPNDWFVLQDGGYPTWLEPILGLFRGEFWLHRNRIERTKQRVAPFNAEAAAEFTRLMRNLASAMVGLMDARDAFLDAPRRALALGIDDVLPRQISRQLIPDLQSFALQRETDTAKPLGKRTLEEVAKQVKASTAYPGFLIDGAKKVAKPFVVGSALEIAHQYFFNTRPGTTNPYTFAVLWPLVVGFAERLFLDRRPDDHALLLLAVGVDAAPGRLLLDDSGERILAYWNLAANVPFSSVQERLIHDVANDVAGELRLNPDSTSRQRPVTVHNLGGCAMSDAFVDGVTDPNGKVWGTRALYVLDGAAIPTSLGTNPSATIAAIAERNVRQALADESSPIHTPGNVPLDTGVPGWPPDVTVAQIQARLRQTPAILDPVSQIPSGSSPAPVAPAVGLSFNEVMRGFWRTGSVVNLPVRTEFVATIPDLNAFLVDPRRGVDITGKVFLTREVGGQPVESAYEAAGTLDLLKRIDTVRALETLFDDWRSRSGSFRGMTDPERGADALRQMLAKQAARYEMDYELLLRGPGGPFRFKAVKTISGGPGLAAWTQTTTAVVEIFDQSGTTKIGDGVLRVHLADFLGTQLPSFEVTGTQDDVRIAWAFGRFFRFFFGTLRQVFVPNLETLNPFGDRTN